MTPDKQTVMLELLKEAWVHVYLDPRRDEVLLPDFLRQQPCVVLQYGYNMPVPIHDLTVDERGISATLSFRRVPYATFIPWTAVFALADGEQRRFVWPDDVPTDLETESAPPPPSAPKLKSVPYPDEAPAPGTTAAPSATTPTTAAKPGPGGAGAGPGQGSSPTKKPRPSHLKLVD